MMRDTLRAAAEQGRHRLIVHHRHTLIGHPGSRRMFFPTIGTPAFRNSRLNLMLVTYEQHMRLHRRAYRAEYAAYIATLPPFTMIRAGHNCYRSWPRCLPGD
jgi:hypothetical protein